MKKIKFLVKVKDKKTGEIYNVGDIREFKDERADEILNKKRANGTHYAELIIEEKVETTAEVETATKTVKAETATKKTIKKNK